ncbi:MAG: hypothetical protein M1500_03235 [Candidatus Marsarchaeota archaeon]|nr:hypothetical protein [Candidatus Marsarchaeota archaeon]MCL5112696.1 hypothetical protein [Candidatus Marsarchaeota archaeon]
MHYIILDTSSILFAAANKKDAFKAIEAKFPNCKIMISTGVLRELRGISSNAGRRGAAAKLSLEMLGYKKVNVDNVSGNVDSWISRKASSPGVRAIVTNDDQLARKLRGGGAAVFKISREGFLR